MQEREQERTAGIGQRMTIGRFSVTHTVLINILMVTILALGVFSLIRLPQEQFAEVPFFWVNVIVPYPCWMWTLAWARYTWRPQRPSRI